MAQKILRLKNINAEIVRMILALNDMVGEQKSILSRDKKRCEQELIAVQRNTKQLQSEYKKAHIEYEKFKYLEEQELQTMMEKIKREEQLYLDEISTMLFAGEISKKGRE